MVPKLFNALRRSEEPPIESRLVVIGNMPEGIGKIHIKPLGENGLFITRFHEAHKMLHKLVFVGYRITLRGCKLIHLKPPLETIQSLHYKYSRSTGNVKSL